MLQPLLPSVVDIAAACAIKVQQAVNFVRFSPSPTPKPAQKDTTDAMQGQESLRRDPGNRLVID